MNMSIHQNIKKARENAGLSKQELAAAIEKSPNYVYQIEGGQKRPPIRLVAKIAEVLGERVTTLLEDDEIVARIRAEVLQDLSEAQIEDAKEFLSSKV